MSMGKPLAIESGCKVGWEIYDNRADAEAAAKRAHELAVRKAEQGYDFGYQTPGTLRFKVEHRDRHDGTIYHNVYEVVTP
jgi:hypothetical protein